MKRATAVAALLVSACIPSFPPDTGLVTTPQVVAMQSVPAEAAAGASVQWNALYVTPSGSVTTAPIDWDLCSVPSALTDTGPVSISCFSTTASDVESIGSGLSVSGAMPTESCRIYGPDPPLAQAGQPAGRPVDPDVTGGYYQPVIMHTTVATLGSTRVSCGVAGATQQAAADFVKQYIPNENPAPSSLQFGTGASASAVRPASQGMPFTVKAGSVNDVVAQWPPCTAGAACAGAEVYVVFDPSSQQIVQHREAMNVSWYTTGGSFSVARNGVTEANAAASQATNTWTAPSTAGTVTLWVVLIDARGGAGWQSYTVQVDP